MNGLQDRSQRYITIAASFFTAGAFLKVVSEGAQALSSADGGDMTLPEAQTAALVVVAKFQTVALVLAAVMLILAMLGFAYSMQHVGVMKNGRFEKRTTADWEELLANKLTLMERWHSRGLISLGVSLAVFIVFLFLSLAAKLCA